VAGTLPPSAAFGGSSPTRGEVKRRGQSPPLWGRRLRSRQRGEMRHERHGYFPSLFTFAFTRRRIGFSEAAAMASAALIGFGIRPNAMPIQAFIIWLDSS
jgi:hypothetical protein